jgi:nucleotide-binding universal stress UspA family protein
MFRNILVPVDGSASATRGLKEAIRLAKERNASLTLLHVVDETPVLQTASVEGGAYFFDELLKGLVADGRKLLDKATAAAKAAGLRVKPVLMEDIGQPVADVIVAQAKKLRADLIVIGTHGRRGLSRVVMGSDAESVVRQSPVPVMLVRLGSRDAEARRPARKAAKKHA